MTLYCTLDDARQELKPNPDNRDGDNAVLAAIRTVSRRIDRELGARRPLFAPTIEARKIRVDSRYINAVDGTFWLGPAGSLLGLSALSVGSSALTVGTHVEGYPDTSMPPFTHLKLLEASGYSSWFGYAECADDGWPLYATVTGVWGLHRDYANAWQKVDDLAAALTDSATTLTVNEIDDADLFGLLPRISAGNLLKIDSEYLEVLATLPEGNKAYVRRGVNGSTAASHDSGADVYVWQVEEPIRRATARQAAFQSARRGAFESVSLSPLSGSEIRYPGDWLAEARAVLNDYALGV